MERNSTQTLSKKVLNTTTRVLEMLLCYSRVPPRLQPTPHFTTQVRALEFAGVEVEMEYLDSINPHCSLLNVDISIFNLPTLPLQTSSNFTIGLPLETTRSRVFWAHVGTLS